MVQDGKVLKGGHAQRKEQKRTGEGEGKQDKTREEGSMSIAATKTGKVRELIAIDQVQSHGHIVVGRGPRRHDLELVQALIPRESGRDSTVLHAKGNR